jgi:hypothetical protein
MDELDEEEKKLLRLLHSVVHVPALGLASERREDPGT